MPRGRHRHSPPLHRLLPPSAIAGVSLICAFGPWMFSKPGVLRVIAAVAAATAVVGAAVMRRWDTQAGKQVADLTRARASDEWRHEEKVAELETDLEESRELRVKLEHRLRAKRAELAALRNEHAALLRRYATAETERASALEGRRLLELETSSPSRALPPVPGGDADAEVTETAESDEKAAAVAAGAERETAAAKAVSEGDGSPEAEADSEPAEASEETPEEGAAEAKTPAAFSPEGSQLFLRANVALSRFDDEGDASEDAGDAEAADVLEAAAVAEAAEAAEAAEVAPKGEPVTDQAQEAVQEPAQEAAGVQEPVQEPQRESTPESAEASAPESAQEDEAEGQPEAVDGHARATASTPTAKPAQPVQQPSGHFTVPTAVAVVPAAPQRRPSVEGGFDFFGTQKNAAAPSPAMESVQNEDLADVVGQEALAVHKAESESTYKPAHEGTRSESQVIDLTAHDETEHIDVDGLRSAAS